MPSIAGNGQGPSNTAPSDDTDVKINYLELANYLWLYSLIFSIFCASSALILQQSLKPHTWITSPRCCLLEQARMGANFARRIEKTNDRVRIFHSMIIFSLLVFYSGLVLYYNNVDSFKAGGVLSFTVLCPFYYLVLKTKNFSWKYAPHCAPFTQEKMPKKGSRLDHDVLKHALDMSRSDDDLEQFFEAIPGYCASKIVDNPQRSLDLLGLERLAEALIEFWNRTWSSNRVSESVKVRRLVICVRVIEAADLSIAVPHILHLFSGDPSGVSRSVETGHSLRSLRNGNAASLARGIIACIISNAERDDRWSMLAMDELGISGDYLAHGNSVLLANLIHIIRHFLDDLQPHPDLTRGALSILPSVSKFDILNTLPELQRDFCDLWNEVVQQAQNSPSEADDNLFVDILVEIRHLYIDLHGATTGHDDIFHQPLCMMPDHHPRSTTRTQPEEAEGNTSGGASQNITIARPIPSPGDVLDASNDTATGLGITQGIAESCIPSMAERVTQSPSGTSGDRPPDREITVSFMVFDSLLIRPNYIR